MYELTQIDFNIFHVKKMVRFVDFCLKANEVFCHYLGNTEPSIWTNDDKMPCYVWSSNLMFIASYPNKIEIKFRGEIFKSEKYDDLIEKIDTFLNLLSLKAARVGVVSNYSIDNDLMNRILKKEDIKQNNVIEFNYSWLKRKNNDLPVTFNIWTYLKLIDEKCMLSFDINSIQGVLIDGFIKIASLCEAIKKEEMKYE